jgi:hypothetical protein
MNKRKVDKNKGLAVMGIVKRIVKPFTSLTSGADTEKWGFTMRAFDVNKVGEM